jgi:hypothetical protein
VTLFAHERTVLAPLPEWVPTVEEIHTRVVDSEGYVTLHTNRYSVPVALIAREVDVHESATTVRVFDPSRRVAERSEPVAEHPRLEDGLAGPLDAPRAPGRAALATRPAPPPMLEQERVLRAASTVIARGSTRCGRAASTTPASCARCTGSGWTSPSSPWSAPWRGPPSTG